MINQRESSPFTHAFDPSTQQKSPALRWDMSGASCFCNSSFHQRFHLSAGHVNVAYFVAKIIAL